MLFRKKTPRACETCLYGTDFSNNQVLCTKHGVIDAGCSCRKYRYDPCKRIPPTMKAPDFSRYNEDDFKLE